MNYSHEQYRRALKHLINLQETVINKTCNYCNDFCPVRDKNGYCSAEHLGEYWFNSGDDIELYAERDFQECMTLQLNYYLEKAN